MTTLVIGGGELEKGAFTICHENPASSVETSNSTAHSGENFPEKMEILRRIPRFGLPENV